MMAVARRAYSIACMLTKLMRGARLVRRLRCTIVDPLSEALTFGLISLILSMIVANPAFSEKQVIRNAASAPIPHSVCRNAARV